MEKGAIIRLITVFAIFLTVIFYNIQGVFKNNTNPVNNSSAEKNLTENKTELKPIGETENKSTEALNEETVFAEQNSQQPSDTGESIAVSAAAVKGKIISKYISPYSAPLSYSNVFLKNSSGVNIDLKNLLASPLSFSIEENGKPQVLIMHTHTTESFMEKDTDIYTEDYNSRSTDNSKNMVRIGEIIAEKLNNAGIVTLHDKTQHDNPKYSGSYSRSAKTVSSYLEKYPSIKIVLDLHRDSVSSGESDKVKLVTEIGGRKAAQIMLVMGSESGAVKDFPNWQENLKLAVKFQQKTETLSPTLARPILLKSKKYNQHLTKGSLLLEIGTDANTLEEACYSAELAGDALAELLKEL